MTAEEERALETAVRQVREKPILAELVISIKNRTSLLEGEVELSSTSESGGVARRNAASLSLGGDLVWTISLHEIPVGVHVNGIVRSSSGGLQALGQCYMDIKGPGIHAAELLLWDPITVQGQAVDAATGVGVAEAAIVHEYSSEPLFADKNGFFQFALPRRSIEMSVAATARYYGASDVRIQVRGDGSWSTVDAKSREGATRESENPIRIERLPNGDQVVVGRTEVSLKEAEIVSQPLEAVFRIPMYVSKSISGTIPAHSAVLPDRVRIFAKGHFYTSPVSLMVDKGEALVGEDGSFRIDGLRGDIRHSLFAVSKGCIHGSLVNIGAGEVALGTICLLRHKPFALTIRSESSGSVEGYRLTLGVALDESFESRPLTDLDGWSRSQTSYQFPVPIEDGGHFSLPVILNCAAGLRVIGGDGKQVSVVSYDEVIESGIVLVP